MEKEPLTPDEARLIALEALAVINTEYIMMITGYPPSMKKYINDIMENFKKAGMPEVAEKMKGIIEMAEKK